MIKWLIVTVIALLLFSGLMPLLLACIAIFELVSPLALRFVLRQVGDVEPRATVASAPAPAPSTNPPPDPGAGGSGPSGKKPHDDVRVAAPTSTASVP